MKSSALSLNALMTGYRVLHVGREVRLGLRQHPRAHLGETSAARRTRSTMLSRLLLSTIRALGRLSSVRPRLSLLCARIEANRFEPVGRGDDVLGLLVQRSGQFGQPGQQLGEATGPPRDGGVRLIGDVLQRTEIALVDHHAERGEHLFGGRVTPDGARAGCSSPASACRRHRRAAARAAHAGSPAATSAPRWPSSSAGRLTSPVQGQLHRGVERPVRTLHRLDARDAADGDIVDHHRRVLRQRGDIRQFHGDRVGAARRARRCRACSASSARRTGSRPACSVPLPSAVPRNRIDRIDVIRPPLPAGRRPGQRSRAHRRRRRHRPGRRDLAGHRGRRQDELAQVAIRGGGGRVSRRVQAATADRAPVSRPWPRWPGCRR